MITPAEFRDRWNGADHAVELMLFPADTLADVAIPDPSKAFLRDAGLPDSAAPFLDFKVPEQGTLPTAAGVWQLDDAFGRYRVIGSNGSGDSICLDEGMDGAVVYLNHDDRFRAVFMNSSIAQLAESLLVYRQMIEETCQRNGEDAYLDGDIPDEIKTWLQSELVRIDSHAMKSGCHWPIELENLDELE